MKAFLRIVAVSTGSLALALSSIAMARAADLKVLAGGSMTASLGELGPQFEKATGHKLVIEFGSTPQLIKEVASGTPFDLGVVPAELFTDEAARARFVAGPTIDIARVGYGIAVRAGAPRPDIGTPDAFRQVLIEARSIAFLPQSAAGAYVLKVFERLDIAQAMQAKTKAQTSTSQIPASVARGEAELGVFLINVLIAPGVELVGPFPAALQQELVFTAAVAASSRNADAAKEFVDYLRTPAASAVLRARGMTPG
jgi:molybdate transport system substrate-binding protein